MSSGAVQDYLKERIGLDPNSIGPAAIQRAIQARVASLHMASLDEYLELLRANEQELHELVESVVVPETWFFRDDASFDVLERIALETLLDPKPIRILSLPCSSGEEPYSIAMTLLTAGWSPTAFSIDAVDISQRALDRARAGVYGKNSFRGELRRGHAYFTQDAQGLAVAPEVKERVRFLRRNFFDSDLCDELHAYQIIFCRNLLIYFDAETQKRAINVLKGLLAKEGRLFVGPAEASLFLDEGFVLCDSVSASVLCAVKKAKTLVLPKPAPKRISLFLPAVQKKNAVAQPPRAEASKLPVLADYKALLDQARTLADKGRTEEAIQQCEEVMEKHGPTTESLLLLALLKDAMGLAHDAIACYRKVLYLQPDHLEAMAHLAAHLERTGNESAVRAIQNRMHRLRNTPMRNPSMRTVS